MSQIKAAYDTIIAIRNNASKTSKISFLALQKNNTFLKEYLRLMYEPRVNFYMKKVEPKFATQVQKKQLTESTLDQLKQSICTRNVSGHDARELVANMSDSFQTEWEKELLALLINRDAKAGFGGNTINKVWPDLVTDVPYMRCCLPKDAKLAQFPWTKGVYSQLKCDGMFANGTHKADGTVTIASRSGSPFPLDQFRNVEAEIKAKIPAGAQIHGELLMYKDGKVLERQDSNGQFNKILQGGEARTGCKIVFVAWDMIPETEAKAKNKYRVPYSTRFDSLSMYIGKDYQVDFPLQVVETKVVHSLEEAYAHYKDALERKLEGTIIKHPDMIWEDTTSKFQVKLKLEKSIDLRCVGFNTGNGKNEKTFGSIKCESADGKFEVNISGFSDADRETIWKDHDSYIGTVVEITANCIMEPTGNNTKYSFFLPRFSEWRLDKNTCDDYNRIISIFADFS